MVKDDVHEKVMKVKMVSDRVMAIVLVIEDDVLRLICGLAMQSRGLEEVFIKS